jgi:hypothetical protein
MNMKKRVVTNIGDIFSIRVNDHKMKYFQLIALDITQLNSDVIRSFRKEYEIGAAIDLDQVVKGEVEFYAHCVTKWGVKMGYWEKVGKSNDVGEIDHILFRGTSDYGHKEGQEPIRVSNRWYIWHIGDAAFTRVGKLEGENRKAEIGVVMDPESIVHRMKTGLYDGYYPDFE